MPYKHNDSRRHKFDKPKYKVTNTSAYNESLRQRGDITFWFSDEALSSWKPERMQGRRGRPMEYSDLAIECCLMIRQVYTLPLRQTQGFMRSLIRVMDLNISAPDFSSISKRSTSLKLKRLVDSITPGTHIIVDSTGIKVYGKDEWHQEKHKVNARRTWRKLHLGIDENHQIIACDLTDNTVGDPTAVENLLDQVDDFEIFFGDGAYDGDPTYDKILNKNDQASIIVPPPKNAAKNTSRHDQRNQHVDFIENHGRMSWQKKINYGLRSHVELAMLRYKTIIGPKLKARKLAQQKTEAEVSVRVINKMTSLGMPVSVKIA